MRISSQLKIMSFVTALAFMIMIPILVWAFLDFNQTKSNYLLAESINQHYVKSNSLRSQYFLYSNQYVLEQLEIQKTEIEDLLHVARSEFSDEDDQQLMRQFPGYIEKIRRIFDRIVKNHENISVSNDEQRIIYAELEKRLISQFSLKASESEQRLRNLLTNATIRIQEDYERLVIITILFAAVLAIAIIFFMSQLSRMISRRLAYLHKGAKIVAGGDLNYRIHDSGHDEFSELAQSINSVTVNLQSFTQKLESEINVRIKTEEELLESKMVAEIANSAKSQFLSRMSHELRTPLNAIIGFSQLQQMEFTKDTPESTRTAMDHINIGGRHLLMLVDDIMDIVRIEQSQLNIPIENLALSNAIAESVSLVQLQADTNQIQLIIEPTQLYLLANHHRLKQVLVNLLSNAIKYNRQGGTVTVQACEVGPDEVEIRITDTGVGIDIGDYESVFEPFTRLKYAESNEIQGIGIGLALSKFLVEQMNGQIGLESSPSAGTVFWLKFSIGQVKSNTAKDDGIEHSASDKKIIAHTVLYIEDNPASRDLMDAFLQHYPEITVLMANTAEEGIKIAEMSMPSVIFIDINLPKMDGITALGILKSLPSLIDTRMFALSASARSEEIKMAMNSGFDEYLTKPIRLEQIVKILEE